MGQPMRKQELSSIVYKGFVFPYNPASTSYKIGRSYIEHKYPELAGSELEDFGPNSCTISCSGTFFGRDGYSDWRRLLNEFKAGGVGFVSHPIFTDVTRGLMVSLTGSVGALPESIDYSFEIIADIEPSIDECLGRYIAVVSATPNSASTSPIDNNKGSFIHTVVSGECLSVICARYASKYNTTISWRKIAGHNSLKNPHLIYPGDQISIYYPTT